MSVQYGDYLKSNSVHLVLTTERSARRRTSPGASGIFSVHSRGVSLHRQRHRVSPKEAGALAEGHPQDGNILLSASGPGHLAADLCRLHPWNLQRQGVSERNSGFHAHLHKKIFIAAFSVLQF